MSVQAVPTHGPAGPRFIRVVKNCLTSEVRWRALAPFALLIGLRFAISGLNVVKSYVGRDFMTAISGRDRAGFVRQAFLSIRLFAASTAKAVSQSFAEQRPGLLRRAWLTSRLIPRDFADQTDSRLKESAALDNPDQRIAEDVKAFMATTLSCNLLFLNGTFTVVAFAGVLWSISPLLFGVAVGSAVLGAVLTTLLGHSASSCSGRAVPNDHILATLRAAGLGPVAERAGELDLERDWQALVSLGDQQLLVLTRMVRAAPRFVFPDRVEATLRPDQVRQALPRPTQSPITPIHLAQAAQSVEQSDAMLEIAGDGAWAWRWTHGEPAPDRGDEVRCRGAQESGLV